MGLDSDFVGHAAATAFGGRITGFAKDPFQKNLQSGDYDKRYPPVNLVVPNSSCSLPLSGGRAMSRMDKPTDVEVDGVRLASLKQAQAEVFDQRTPKQVSTHARVRVEGFEIGIDEQLSIRESDFELVSDVTLNESNQRVYTFGFRKRLLEGVEFAGRPLVIKFREDLPLKQLMENEITWFKKSLEESLRGDTRRDEWLKLFDSSYGRTPSVDAIKMIDSASPKLQELWKRLPYYRPAFEANAFSVVEKVLYNGVTYSHVVPLPNLGTAYFGEVIVTETSWRFSLVRLALGSPMQGDAVHTDIIRNGQ